MVQIEHINIVVKDLAGSLNFYKAAFPHWSIRAKGEMNWYGKVRNWLHFGDDYFYLSLNDSGEGENRNLKGVQVGLAHVGFVTNNLNRTIQRLRAAGFKVDKDGADSQYRKNAYFLDPDGYEVEFVEYLSDLPIERNSEE